MSKTRNDFDRRALWGRVLCRKGGGGWDQCSVDELSLYVVRCSCNFSLVPGGGLYEKLQGREHVWFLHVWFLQSRYKKDASPFSINGG